MPSGASTGRHEAFELRDTEHPHYLGRGVQKAINHVSDVLKNALIGVSVFEQGYLDRFYILPPKPRTATPNKSDAKAIALLGGYKLPMCYCAIRKIIVACEK